MNNNCRIFRFLMLVYQYKEVLVLLYQLFETLMEKTKGDSIDLHNLIAGENGVRCVRYRKGTDIVTTFDKAKSCYLVYKGEYQETNYSSAGQKNVLAVRRAPQIIGIVQMIERLPYYSTNMEAITEVEAIEINNVFFRRELEMDGRLGLLMLHNLSTKIIEASQKLKWRNFWGTRENFLLYLYDQYTKSKKELPFVIDKSNRCIAEELGISERTLYRILNGLRTEGIINVQDGNIVLDEKMVEAIALDILMLE